MDVTLAECSISESTYAHVQSGETSHELFPSKELNDVIRQKAQELDMNLQMSKLLTSDVFYTDPSQGTWQDIAERTGADCVEMESFALFHNANMLNKRAAALLTISDSFVTKHELTPEERQNAFTEMMHLALESAIAL